MYLYKEINFKENLVEFFIYLSMRNALRKFSSTTSRIIETLLQ